MPDLTTSQRAEMIDLIEAIYSHEGERPELPAEWREADEDERTHGEQLIRDITEYQFVSSTDPRRLDLHAFVGVWVPWLADNDWCLDKQHTFARDKQPLHEYRWQRERAAIRDPNFMLATARAVRAQQTGGA